MKNNKDCELVKDLLPTYIDGLTSYDTNSFIEQHLKECTKCNEIFKNMKKDFEKESQKLNKEVKYAKKYNIRMRILILIISIIIAIFLIMFLRNAIIIKSLSKKTLAYENCNNFHLMWSTYSKENTTIFDTYYKDGKYLKTLSTFNYGQEDLNSKVIFYSDGSGKVAAYNNIEKTIYYQDSENVGLLFPKSFSHITMFEENIWEFLKVCLTTQITSEKCNNRDCYKFNRFNLYVDKETGLSIRGEEGIKVQENYSDVISDVIYEFDTVTDEDIKMPSTEGYIVIE